MQNQDAFNTFTDVEEFRLFVRRADKLLPASIDDIAPNVKLNSYFNSYSIFSSTILE